MESGEGYESRVLEDGELDWSEEDKYEDKNETINQFRVLNDDELHWSE